MTKRPPAFARADRVYVGCVFAFYFLLIGVVLLLAAFSQDLNGRRSSELAEWLCLASAVSVLIGAVMLVVAFWYKHKYLDRCNRCKYPRVGLQRGAPCPECGEDDPAG